MEKQTPICNMMDIKSSACWTERVKKELRYNEAKNPSQGDADMASSMFSEGAGRSRMSSQRGGGSDISLTSSVVGRIEDLQRQLVEEKRRTAELELKVAAHEAAHTTGRIFPDS